MRERGLGDKKHVSERDGGRAESTGTGWWQWTLRQRLVLGMALAQRAIGVIRIDTCTSAVVAAADGEGRARQ